MEGKLSGLGWKGMISPGVDPSGVDQVLYRQYKFFFTLERPRKLSIMLANSNNFT